MGSGSSKTEPPTGQTQPPSGVDKTKAEAGEKPKCKPCCACPETRKARDMCIADRGEENCTELIEAHKECMRKLGYKLA